MISKNRLEFSDKIPVFKDPSNGFSSSNNNLALGPPANVFFSFHASDCKSIVSQNLFILPYKSIAYIKKIMQQISCFANIKFFDEYSANLNNNYSIDNFEIAICRDLYADEHDKNVKVYYSHKEYNKVAIIVPLSSYAEESKFNANSVVASLLRVLGSAEINYEGIDNPNNFSSINRKYNDISGDCLCDRDQILENLTILDVKTLIESWGPSHDYSENCNSMRAKFAAENSEYVFLSVTYDHFEGDF